MAKSKKLKINCKGTRELPLDELIEFQGSLKSLPPERRTKLITSLNKFGFIAPIFVWNKKMLDGHQRVRTLKYLRDKEGYTIPPLPVVDIMARTEKNAKQILLRITSQYGKFSRVGLDAYIDEFSIEDLDDISLMDNELKLDQKLVQFIYEEDPGIQVLEEKYEFVIELDNDATKKLELIKKAKELKLKYHVRSGV